jgi:hypothetical protein
MDRPAFSGAEQNQSGASLSAPKRIGHGSDLVPSLGTVHQDHGHAVDRQGLPLRSTDSTSFHHLGDSGSEAFPFFDQLLELSHQVLRLRLQRLGGLVELGLERLHHYIRLGSGNRLDPAYARGDSPLSPELEESDLPGAPYVSPAAKFDGGVSHEDDSHDIAVLLRKESHRTQRECVGIGHAPCGHGDVVPDPGVHLPLDGLQHLRIDRPVMGKVEPEVILVHQRTLLPDVGSEIFAQRCVNQVSRAVVSLDVAAADRVNPGTAGGRLELLSEDPANHRPLGVLTHLVHWKVPSLPLHDSGIADLSTGLHVERILPQQYLDPAAVLAEGEQLGLHVVRLVPHELLAIRPQLTPLARSIHMHSRASALLGRPGVARALALFVQRRLEPGNVDRGSPLFRDEHREIEGESESIVELEDLFAGDDGRPGPKQRIQPGEPAFDGFEEPLLLHHGPLTDLAGFGAERGIHLSHFVNDDIGERSERGFPASQEPRMADRATKNPAQHIAPSLVAREAVVTQQEGHRPCVVGEYPE